jgi:hypothetical protein
MKTVVQPVPRKDESDLEELQANEFASGVIRGIKEFKAGKDSSFQSNYLNHHQFSSIEQLLTIFISV